MAQARGSVGIAGLVELDDPGAETGEQIHRPWSGDRTLEVGLAEAVEREAGCRGAHR